MVHLDRDGQGRRYLQEMVAIEGVADGYYYPVPLKQRVGGVLTPLTLEGATGLKERLGL